jgi:hypothetical protein
MDLCWYIKTYSSSSLPGVNRLASNRCFFTASGHSPRQPVKVQKLFMLGVAGACVLLAGVMAASLVAPAGVMAAIHGAFWFIAKVAIYVYVFLWVRFTFPRYRFDQLMRLGWHFLIPLALVNVIVAGTVSPRLTEIVGTLLMLGVAVFLAREEEQHVQAVDVAAESGEGE